MLVFSASPMHDVTSGFGQLLFSCPNLFAFAAGAAALTAAHFFFVHHNFAPLKTKPVDFAFPPFPFLIGGHTHAHTHSHTHTHTHQVPHKLSMSEPRKKIVIASLFDLTGWERCARLYLLIRLLWCQTPSRSISVLSLCNALRIFRRFQISYPPTRTEEQKIIYRKK